ncbi:MAG TPA: TIR domain-containing protein [Candidatus Kapabacteria bacterium]|nr:TIR domain-containing protein [Candidatus Kapabacteria bacterium]
MADIFISYSSKDREKAEQLTELLASAGLSVWIDQSNLEVSSSWSKEIVQAINDCKAFVVLLSPASLESHNVIKEVSLASEKRKKILPLDLEPVALTEDFEYQLAGIQRAPMTNIDAILRALGKLGLEATQAPELKIVKETDGRKSLMILPFEDLSPTGDNGWFADGIVSELIAALSNVKALKLADSQATKEFKQYHGQLTTYAREMGIRYFVQGDVRKFGDQIKIGARLLDIDTGDHLWQDSLRGEMKDIFDIQEAVAKKVTEGLNVILTADEKQKLAERGTENAEAYELFLKGNEYFTRNTKEGFQLAAQVWSEAIRLDPAYAQAYSGKANALAAIYRSYNRDPHLLDEGFSLVQEAKRLKPDLTSVNRPLSYILMLQGKWEEAENAAQDFIRSDPQDLYSYFSLGFFYGNTGQHAKSIAAFEEALKLEPDDLPTISNLVIACNNAKEDSKQKQWALAAIPKYEKYLKLFPDDESARVWHAVLLHHAGLDEDARAAGRKLDTVRDEISLFNTACLHCMLKDYSSGIATFRKVIAAGYRNIQTLKSFLEDETEGIGTLKGTPEWEAVREMVDKLEQESAETSNG